MSRIAIVAAALIGLAACAPHSTRAASQNRNLITADEIERSNASNAMEAIERLRPAFLRTRGAQSIRNAEPSTPIVYVDGMRYGTLQSLSTIAALSIFSIEYMNAIDASQRFGMGHGGGAIVISTRH